MAKTKEELKPNHAPIYCSMYPKLAKIAHQHGYAMAVHGSVASDFDLICVPWVDNPSPYNDVISEIMNTFAVKKIGELTLKNHGRQVQTLSITGSCYLDLSFTPKYSVEL